MPKKTKNLMQKKKQVYLPIQKKKWDETPIWTLLLPGNFWEFTKKRIEWEICQNGKIILIYNIPTILEKKNDTLKLKLL